MNVRVTPNLDDGVCKISAVLHSLLGLFLNLQLICEPGTNKKLVDYFVVDYIKQLIFNKTDNVTLFLLMYLVQGNRTIVVTGRPPDKSA